jgi:hypothetical protein
MGQVRYALIYQHLLIMVFFPHYRAGWFARIIVIVGLCCSQSFAGTLSNRLNDAMYSIAADPGVMIGSFEQSAPAGLPLFEVDTNAISFGTVKLAAWKDSVVTISNGSTDTLKITLIKSNKTYFTVRPAALTIPPGESKTDTIRFKADSIGLRSALIIFTSNTSLAADTIKVNGFGQGTPKLVMSRISVTFPSTKLSAAVRDTVKIQNKGTDTLKVTNISATHDAYSVTRTVMNIAPGKSITDTIWYRPTAIGTNAGRLLLESNDPTTPDTVKVTGFSSGVPVFVSDAKAISFGDIKLTLWKDTVITISNTGTDTLKIKTITSSKTYFTARPTLLNIPPGTSKTDTIRFKADSIGIRSANIYFASNDATTPDTIKVNGFGIGTPKLVLSRISMKLATAKLTQSTRDTLKLQNKGTDTLKVTDITSSHGTFSVSRSAVNIAPGKTYIDTVIFTPSEIGTTSGTLFLESNDTLSQDSVSVSGFATGTPVFSVDQNPLSVGTVTLGTWKDTLLTITNTGSDTLKIKSVTSTQNYFTVRPTILTIPPGSSKTDTVRFKPDSIGTRSASLVFSSNDAALFDTILVNGFGAGTPRLVLSRSDLILTPGKIVSNAERYDQDHQ